MARVEVLHEHVGHARVDGQRRQELSESLQPAGGGPYPDDGEGFRLGPVGPGPSAAGSEALPARPRAAARVEAVRASRASGWLG